MNLQFEKPLIPIRVLIINPLTEAGVMLCIKIMRGVMFGLNQMVNLTLLVYSNELEKAMELKIQLDHGGFPCNNGVTFISEVPSFSDADVFIFITHLPNLNELDFDQLDMDEVFDSLYLLLKIANNLEMPPPPEKPEHEPLVAKIRKQKKPDPKPRRPVICADGLVALDILKSFSKDLPNDIFFSLMPHSGITKTIMGDKLGVSCEDINNVYTWAANDDVFHVEVENPVYVRQQIPDRERCEWEAMANLELQEKELDLMQFNASWMKKDLIQRVAANTRNHPHESIYKADKLVKLVQFVYKSRLYPAAAKKPVSLGIISDGSLETSKGLPYILPLVFDDETYKVSEYYKDDYHLKQEIKRINKTVQDHHRKLMRHCKEFYEKNVVNMEFVHKVDESSGGYSTGTSVSSGGVSSF